MLPKMFRALLPKTPKATPPGPIPLAAHLAEGLHCSLEAGPSWTQPVDNLAYLASVDLRHDLAAFLAGIYPSFLLPSYLHEAMHHWCFTSPLGTTTSLLWLRTHRKIEEQGYSKDDANWDILDDFVRYQSVIRILRPLAEGLALFAEHDLVPADSEIAPPFFTMAGLKFTDAKTFNPATLMEEADDAFRRLLISYRLGPGLEARASLLIQGMTTEGGGYLPGYLLVKMLRSMLVQMDDRMLDGPYFLCFLRSYFYEDLGFVGKLLDPTLHDQKIAAAVFESFQRKISAMRRLTSDDFDQFERFFLSGAGESFELESSAFPDYGRTAAEKAEGWERAGMLVAELEEVEGDTPELSALKALHANIINQRHLFRLGSTKLKVVVRHGRFTTFSDDEAMEAKRPVLSGPALPDAAEAVGDGRVEYWTTPTYFNQFLIVFCGDDIVAFQAMNQNSTSQSEEAAGHVASRYSARRSELDRRVADHFAGTSAEEVLKLVLRNIDASIEKRYLELACPSGRRDISQVLDQMRRRGFYDLLDRDADAVRLLAVYSFAGSHGLAAKRSFLSEIGLDRTGLPGKLERLLKACDIDVLRGDRAHRVTLRV